MAVENFFVRLMELSAEDDNDLKIGNVTPDEAEAIMPDTLVKKMERDIKEANEIKDAAEREAKLIKITSTVMGVVMSGAKRVLSGGLLG